MRAESTPEAKHGTAYTSRAHVSPALHIPSVAAPVPPSHHPTGAAQKRRATWDPVPRQCARRLPLATFPS